jgi:hypothetical protein
MKRRGLFYFMEEKVDIDREKTEKGYRLLRDLKEKKLTGKVTFNRKWPFLLWLQKTS